MAASLIYEGDISSGSIITAIGSISAANILAFVSANGQATTLIEIPK